MPNLEEALARLYEDPSLTEELTDSPANTLLQWAENRLKTIVEEAQDEETFEERFKEFRKLLKSMNRFTGKRQEMDATEQQESVSKIVMSAQALGMKPTSDPASMSFVQQSAAQDSEENTLNALIALVENASAATPPVTLPEVAIKTPSGTFSAQAASPEPEAPTAPPSFGKTAESAQAAPPAPEAPAGPPRFGKAARAAWEAAQTQEEASANEPPVTLPEQTAETETPEVPSLPLPFEPLPFEPIDEDDGTSDES